MWEHARGKSLGELKEEYEDDDPDPADNDETVPEDSEQDDPPRTDPDGQSGLNSWMD